MNELDLTSEALARVRAEFSPSSTDKARLRSALGLPTPGASLLAAEPAAGPLTQSAALRASGTLGVALASLLFGAGVAVGWGWRHAGAPELEALPSAPLVAAASAAPPPPEVQLPELQLPQVPALVAAPALDGVPVEHGARRARAHAAPVAAARAVNPLAAELGLLRRVERALRGNDPALARALLGELDARFPQTLLAEERLAARNMADCRLDSPGAAAQARAFLREHPASVYSERVQLACALETTSAVRAH